MQNIPYERPRSTLQAGFFLVPSFVVLSSLSRDHAAAWVLCLGAGVTWQLVFRRDLADRLMRICTCTAVAIVTAASMQAVAGTRFYSDSPGGFLAIMGLLSGLVLTEQVLRQRDDRRPAPAPEEGVAARP